MISVKVGYYVDAYNGNTGYEASYWGAGNSWARVYSLTFTMNDYSTFFYGSPTMSGGRGSMQYETISGFDSDNPFIGLQSKVTLGYEDAHLYNLYQGHKTCTSTL